MNFEKIFKELDELELKRGKEILEKQYRFADVVKGKFFCPCCNNELQKDLTEEPEAFLDPSGKLISNRVFSCDDCGEKNLILDVKNNFRVLDSTTCRPTIISGQSEDGKKFVAVKGAGILIFQYDKNGKVYAETCSEESSYLVINNFLSIYLFDSNKERVAFYDEQFSKLLAKTVNFAICEKQYKEDIIKAIGEKGWNRLNRILNKVFTKDVMSFALDEELLNEFKWSHPQEFIDEFLRRYPSRKAFVNEAISLVNPDILPRKKVLIIMGKDAEFDLVNCFYDVVIDGRPYVCTITQGSKMSAGISYYPISNLKKEHNFEGDYFIEDGGPLKKLFAEDCISILNMKNLNTISLFIRGENKLLFKDASREDILRIIGKINALNLKYGYHEETAIRNLYKNVKDLNTLESYIDDLSCQKIKTNSFFKKIGI